MATRTVQLIVAPTFAEAHRFAREQLGLGHGGYRVVNSAGTIKAMRNADLHLVKGWERRFDRFAIKQALKWSRVNIIDHGDEVVEVIEEPVADELGCEFGAGPAHETQVVVEVAPARRRRRCKACGDLVEPDEVESHKSTCSTREE